MPTSRSAAALDRGFGAPINLAWPPQCRRRPRLGKITQPPPGLADGALPRRQRNPAPHADFALGAALDRGFAALIDFARRDRGRRRPRLGKITQPPPGLADGALPGPQRNPAPHADFALGARARPRRRGPDQPRPSRSASATPPRWQNNSAAARPLTLAGTKPAAAVDLAIDNGAQSRFPARFLSRSVAPGRPRRRIRFARPPLSRAPCSAASRFVTRRHDLSRCARRSVALGSASCHSGRRLFRGHGSNARRHRAVAQAELDGLQIPQARLVRQPAAAPHTARPTPPSQSSEHCEIRDDSRV